MSTSLSYKIAVAGFASLFFVTTAKAAFPTRITDDNLTAPVKRDIESKVTTAGSIIPYRKTIFTPPYVGYVKKLHVKLGDRVKAGDPVVTVAQTLRGNFDEANPMRAPFTGVITQVLRSEGEWVEANLQSAMVRMDDTTRLFLTCDVAETDVLKIKVGSRAKVKVNAIIDRPYEAVVREIALAAKDRREGWSRNGDRVEFEVRMEIIDKDENLRPGLSALIDIITESRKSVLSIPHEFLMKDNDKYLVTLSNGQKKEVKIGLKSDLWVEIVSGLSEQDKVRMVDFYSMKEGG